MPETLEASLVLGAATLKQHNIGEAEIEAALNELRADRGFLLASDRAFSSGEGPAKAAEPKPPAPDRPPASDADLPLPPAVPLRAETAQKGR